MLIIAIIIGYNYVYKDHRNIAAQKADFSLTSEALINEFSINPTEAEVIYLNKVVEISGVTSEINANELTLNNQVFCQLEELTDTPISISKHIKIKGRVIGYDDLLEQIKLDQCYIINN